MQAACLLDHLLYFVTVLYVLGLKTSVLPTSIWHSQMCQLC
jgi:hypothetical protein